MPCLKRLSVADCPKPFVHLTLFPIIGKDKKCLKSNFRDVAKYQEQLDTCLIVGVSLWGWHTPSYENHAQVVALGYRGVQTSVNMKSISSAPLSGQMSGPACTRRTGWGAPLGWNLCLRLLRCLFSRWLYSGCWSCRPSSAESYITSTSAQSLLPVSARVHSLFLLVNPHKFVVQVAEQILLPWT